MALLVECPRCKNKQATRARKCKKCDVDLTKVKEKTYYIDFYVKGNALIPGKTDPPLVINADAMLTGTPPSKRFESVSRRDAEVIQVSGIIEHT